MSDAWKEAIAEACTVAMIDWDEGDAAGSLRRLIDWRVEMALDPQISERARALAGQPHASITSVTERKADGVANMPGGYTKVGYVMRSKGGDAVIVVDNVATWLTRYAMYCLQHNHVKFGIDE